ncbi:MAG: hypothetical protein V1793_20795 [Pseudomonadota bacterium]
MKKVKLFFGLLILIFAGLIIYQNREYFFAKQALSLSLGVETWHWTAPGIANLAYFGIFLLLGLVITGFMGISSKLKSKKIIKALNGAIESHLEMISTLKTELQTYKNDPYAAPEKTGTVPETPANPKKTE